MRSVAPAVRSPDGDALTREVRGWDVRRSTQTIAVNDAYLRASHRVNVATTLASIRAWGHVKECSPKAPKAKAFIHLGSRGKSVRYSETPRKGPGEDTAVVISHWQTLL